MKNFDLVSMGVQEMSTQELKETDGGIIGLLIVCVAALLLGSSCISNTPVYIEEPPAQNKKPTENTPTKND